MTHSTATFGSERFTSRLEDSLVVGETGNIGNPVTPEEVAYGRSLPKPPIPTSRSAATNITIIAMRW